MSEMINIPGRLHDVSSDGVVAGANEIYDDTKGKNQQELNQELVEQKEELHEEYELLQAALDNLNPDQTEALALSTKVNELDEESVKITEQSFTDEEKTQARANLGFGDGDIDETPTAGSDNLIKSGGVQNELALGAVYDVSAKNPTAGPNNNGKFESLSALLSDANLNTLIPTVVRKGGMSIKFVQSSDNKYVQARLMAQNFTTDVTQWQGVDDEPTAGSRNLITSNGVYPFQLKLDGLNQNITKEQASGITETPVNLPAGTKVHIDIDRGSDSYTLYYKFFNSGNTAFVDSGTLLDSTDVVLNDSAVKFYMYVTPGHTGQMTVNISVNGLIEKVSNIAEDLQETQEDLQETQEDLQETQEDLQETQEDLQETQEDLQETQEDLQETQEDLALKAYEVEPSINLFDPDSIKIISGKYISAGGVINDGTSYFISGPVEVKAGQSITLNEIPSGTAMAAYSDENAEHVISGKIVSSQPLTITNNTQTAFYVRFSGKNDKRYEHYYMLNYGTTSLPYQDYLRRKVLRTDDILQDTGNSEEKTISQKRITELVNIGINSANELHNQDIVAIQESSHVFEVSEGVELNTTGVANRLFVKMPSGRKIRVKVNYINGNIVNFLFFYKQDGTTWERVAYGKNNEFVEYVFDEDYVSLGFFISASSAIADGIAQATVKVEGRVDALEGDIENVNERIDDVEEEIAELEGRSRIRLSDVLYHWLNGEKFPIGFLGDSTTDGTSTTDWITVPSENINQPCSHPGTEAVWWLTQTTEGQAYYSEQESLGKTLYEICYAAHLQGKGRGKVLYNWTHAYPYILRDLLRKELGNNLLEVYNIGYYGSSLGNIYAQLETIYGDVYSDVKMVGIVLGINDRGHASDPADYYNDLVTLLTQCVEFFLNKNITPFMVTNQVVTQCGNDPNTAQYSALYQDYIQALCNEAKQYVAKQYDLEVIDMNNFGRLLMESSNYSYANITEDLHFKDLGHKLEAGYIFSEIIPWINKTNNAEKLYFGFNCANCKTGFRVGNVDAVTSDKFKIQLNTTQDSAVNTLIFDAYMFNNSKNGAYTVKYLTPVASGYIVIDGDTDNPITINSTEMTLDPWDIGLHHVQVYTGESTTIAFKGFLLEQQN